MSHPQMNTSRQYTLDTPARLAAWVPDSLVNIVTALQNTGRFR